VPSNIATALTAPRMSPPELACFGIIVELIPNAVAIESCFPTSANNRDF
jgi:hypothetical protein